MIFTFIMIIGILPAYEASLLITDVDPDLDDVKNRLAQVERNLANMVTQMNEVKERLDNLETKQAVPTSRTACLNGWLAYKGSRYYFGTSAVNFATAEVFCKSKGANLVHIENQDENVFLQDFMLAHSKQNVYYWLGITDIEDEGVWKFIGEDTTAPYFDWATKYSEPDGGSSENCARFSSGKQFKWTDVPCTFTSRYLCEQN